MDTAERSYVDFEPSSQIVPGKEEDTVLIHLPGFSSEQLRVEADTHGNLRARGERRLDGSRWSRFTKDFRLPPDCDVNNIQAEFKNDTLYVILPKIVPPAAQKPSAPLSPPPLPPPPPPPPPQQPQPLERKKSAAPPPTPEPPREKQAREEEKEREGGLAKGLERPRRRTLLLNVAVAVAVLVGMGIYVIFKALRKPGSDERSK